MVEERRREIGVRLALGATRAAVVKAVVGGTRWPLLAGLGIGVLLSLAASQILRGAL
jgi:ABC-type antimicrobial peptide transport system permease subunit